MHVLLLRNLYSLVHTILLRATLNPSGIQTSMHWVFQVTIHWEKINCRAPFQTTSRTHPKGRAMEIAFLLWRGRCFAAATVVVVVGIKNTSSQIVRYFRGRRRAGRHLD